MSSDTNTARCKDYYEKNKAEIISKVGERRKFAHEDNLRELGIPLFLSKYCKPHKATISLVITQENTIQELLDLININAVDWDYYISNIPASPEKPKRTSEKIRQARENRIKECEIHGIPTYLEMFIKINKESISLIVANTDRLKKMCKLMYDNIKLIEENEPRGSPKPDSDNDNRSE